MIKNKKASFFLNIFIDLLVFGVCLVVFALFHHALPYRKAIEAGIVPTPATLADFSEKFADKFASPGEIIKTDTSYKTENVSIETSVIEYEEAVCHVADIYVRNVSFIKTAFAEGSFGKTIVDSTLNMAIENKAALAISGDYYGIRDRSIVIRNGNIYRTTKAHDVCVLYYNGVMETYRFKDFNVTDAINSGAWQAWDFGPSLIESDGKARTDFSNGIAGPNPRSTVGYYEPGHYVFIAVDGRQSTSLGLGLEDLAKLYESLGVKAAYNLDGGHSAVMTFFDRYLNSPSAKGGRDISDIIYIPYEEQAVKE